MKHSTSIAWWRRILPARILPAAVLAVVLLPLAAACGHDQPANTGSATPATGTPSAGVPGAVTVPLGDRPFPLYVPMSYHPGGRVPLVVALHGYTSNSTELASYFGLAAEADRRGFLVALPNGTVDSNGDHFWNATNACCDMDGSGVDDSSYLSSLITTVERLYTVDTTRVFVIGHSNGGYMAHRFACDHADQVTAIASLSGVVWADPTRCRPSRPVSVLQMHGTADEMVSYTGGTFGAGADFPGAEQTVAQWRSLDHCGATAGTRKRTLDLDKAVSGPETDVVAYQGCAGGTRVQLWRLNGSHHVPELSTAFTPAMLDFLYATAAQG